MQYIKDNTENKVYTLRDKSLGISLEKAIRYIEDNNLENDLREEVITLWEEIESKFDSDRKPKKPIKMEEIAYYGIGAILLVLLIVLLITRSKD